MQNARQAWPAQQDVCFPPVSPVRERPGVRRPPLQLERQNFFLQVTTGAAAARCACQRNFRPEFHSYPLSFFGRRRSGQRQRRIQPTSKPIATPIRKPLTTCSPICRRKFMQIRKKFFARSCDRSSRPIASRAWQADVLPARIHSVGSARSAAVPARGGSVPAPGF